jgi:DNA-directed RNA polymerase subunit beta'
VMKNLPVLPPLMRPMTQLDDGNLNVGDLNNLYRDVALLNGQLNNYPEGLPEDGKNPLRTDLYDALQALSGIGGNPQKKSKGVLQLLSPASSPKHGYFQTKVSQRRQDLTMRSIIVPEPNMGLDEIGIPRKAAMELYKPFIVREMGRQGYPPLQAQEMIDKKDPLADKALESAIKERPVIFKRDPALHMFNVLAFKPRLTDGVALRIHPLVTGAYNADFDGDTMSVFVPVSPEAVQEAYSMLPSRNLFNPATGYTMYQPTLDSSLGLYLSSLWGGGPSKGSFANHAEVKAALKDGKVLPTDTVKLGKVTTTAGRVMLDAALPKGMRGGKHLTDKTLVLDTKTVDKVFTEVAKKFPNDFGNFANKMKDLGFGTASAGFSYNLKDFQVSKEIRNRILKGADAEAVKVRALKLPKTEQDKRLVRIYGNATQEMRKAYGPLLTATGNNLFKMHKAGIKPAWGHMEQMLWAPMLISGPSGTIPDPVKRSYSEGLDVAGYWNAAQGARKVLMEKVVSVMEPGALSKQIMNSAMNQLITETDCKTTKGVGLPALSREVLDRFTAAPVKVRGRIIPSGSLITPELQSTFANNKIGKIVVRSPMRCTSKDGMCSKCYGLEDNGKSPELGANVGAISAQALGERATQLSMRTFHSGGTAASGTELVNSFKRLTQLLKFPKNLPNEATLSDIGGTIGKIEKDPAGGWGVFVGEQRHYVPQNLKLKVKKGDAVTKGMALSSGPIHPSKLLELTGMNKTQNYLADEMYDLYKSEGVKRRNMEVVVRALTNLTRVDNAGGHPDLIRGDLTSITKTEAWNRENPTKRVKHVPFLKGVNTLPLAMQEDWMARMQFQKLKQTVMDASAEGWKSNIHGAHPIPALAYSAEFGQPEKGGAPKWAY